jgi:hypothetical protein
VLGANPADHHVSLLQSIFGKKKDVLRFLERLRFGKVNSVFRLVDFALPWIEFEFHGTLLAYFGQGID